MQRSLPLGAYDPEQVADHSRVTVKQRLESQHASPTSCPPEFSSRVSPPNGVTPINPTIRSTHLPVHAPTWKDQKAPSLYSTLNTPSTGATATTATPTKPYPHTPPGAPSHPAPKVALTDLRPHLSGGVAGLLATQFARRRLFHCLRRGRLTGELSGYGWYRRPGEALAGRVRRRMLVAQR